MLLLCLATTTSIAFAKPTPEKFVTLERVAKRWAAKKKVTFGETIVLVADGEMPMQFVADLLIAAGVHFPNLALSAGFE